ncbi:MAG: 30S ribosomal protein S4e [Thermoproteota archaeon]|nr:MAG: 30S ribosomal protein S4e [Candidatus Korarchaeota archaeon]
MTNKGGSRKMKRMAAPAYWPVARKTLKWTVKPNPGPHPIESSIPLLILVRDVLGLASSAAEAKKIIHMKKIYVDGKPRWDHKFPVGLMDVISIPDLDSNYRVSSDPYKVLKLVKIDKGEAGLKVVKVIKKTTYAGGRIQLTAHDGKNFLVDPKSELSKVIPGDSLLISLPSLDIERRFPLVLGAPVMVIRGKASGHIGRVEEIGEFITVRDIKNPNLLYRVFPENVIVLGERDPAISV